MGPVTGYTNVNLLTVNQAEEVTLDKIKKTLGGTREICKLLNGDLERGYTLFRKAIEQQDAVAMVCLSPALFTIKLGIDWNADYSGFVYCDILNLLISAYDAATGEQSDWKFKLDRSLKILHQAAEDRNFIERFFQDQIHALGQRRATYILAAFSRPFIDMDIHSVNHSFGIGLKNGSAPRSKPFYEGLSHWVKNRRCHILYPQSQSFSSLMDSYFSQNLQSEFFESDGFCFCGNTVITPSEEQWKTFCAEKLNNIVAVPETDYFFEYDLREIIELVNQHEIKTSLSCEEVRRPGDAPGIGDKIRFSAITLYRNDSRMGAISVSSEPEADSFTIVQTINEPEEIQPVVRFIENILRRTGSNLSARDWLEYISEL